jgi:glycosyltransferase involved in cell wall biosynthesis
MISIIVPAHNEEKSIGKILRDILALQMSAEVIVVDDGSTDSTYEIARDFPVKIIRHESGRGYGAAIKTGIREAINDIIVTCDADAEHSAEDIPKLVNYIKEYDMVIGSRPFQRVPLLRKPAKWILNKLANYLVDCKIPDLNSGLRVFKKGAAIRFFHILPKGFSLSTTLTLAFLGADLRVKFVPVSYNARVGKSKIRPLHDTLNFFQLIVRVVMYFNPLKIFLPISMLLFFMGFVLLGTDLFISHNVGDASVITLNTAILILMLGLLADLINKKLVN